MTIRLRAHHLLCLLTYAGKGYSPAFTAGFTAIARRIANGESITLERGPDEVCAPMLGDPACHCHDDSVARRDRRAARDIAALLGRPVRPGDELVLDAATLAHMRKAFATGALRGACGGCGWSGLCRDIAADGYGAAILSACRPARMEP
ncbi:DUF1284 domain-containing protein [Paracoccus subflavus]|uniref:DUF1284 domain-containing protein n=1 Tax=Paracoccus subflavus TaxID=2528244 RepID=A0A4V2JCL1_9RHOB|nr:DUF1284 domain-containing protein [Paracoccus subflavus]TBN42528.1 DUF1284 domain-containing protein [Paracoccus subflavus]